VRTATGDQEARLLVRIYQAWKAFGLYKDDHVAKNCTPQCLPEFITIEAAKRE
jgi:hypothetical protein